MNEGLKTGMDCLGKRNRNRSILGALILCLGVPSFGIAQDIAPPDQYRPKVAPYTGEKEADGDLERLRSRRKKREKRSKGGSGGSVKSLDDRLKEEAEKPGPMRLIGLAGLVLPYIATFGNERESYQSDLGVLVEFMWKPMARQNDDNAELWLGFRSLHLTGSGVYDKTAGRFGFSYFGPMVGVGKVSPALFAGEPGAARLAGRPRASQHREAFFWHGGLSLQNRQGKVERGRDRPKDFDTQGVTIDVPGLWTEFTWSQIHYSRIGYNTTIGAQMGEGKLFLYLALSVGFWH